MCVKPTPHISFNAHETGKLHCSSYVTIHTSPAAAITGGNDRGGSCFIDLELRRA